MTLILPNKRNWFGYRMSWSAKRPIQRDYLLFIWKRKKWFFSKLTKTPHYKERFLHHKVLKRKFSSFLKFLLNKLILKSPCRLDQKSPSSHWLTKCLPIFMNYVLTWSSQKRYVGSPSKTRSQLSEWPLNRSNSWIMSRLHPPKKGT